MKIKVIFRLQCIIGGFGLSQLQRPMDVCCVRKRLQLPWVPQGMRMK